MGEALLPPQMLRLSDPRPGSGLGLPTRFATASPPRSLEAPCFAASQLRVGLPASLCEAPPCSSAAAAAALPPLPQRRTNL